MRTLLLGCGHRRDKIMVVNGKKGWGELTTLDHNPNCGADIVWDLNRTPWPIEDCQYNEVHAYEVLEHLGQQGDEHAFFAHFYEIWRILKPKGVLCATVPMWNSVWAWGDPSHKRIINRGSLGFLNQAFYEQLGNTAATDFRHLMKGPAGIMDLKPIYLKDHEHQFHFALERVA